MGNMQKIKVNRIKGLGYFGHRVDKKDAHAILKEVRRTLNTPEGASITEWAKEIIEDMEKAKKIIKRFGLWQLWQPKTDY